MTYIPKTKHDYPLDEVISALQKEVRRGNEREALWWAFELMPTFEKYLWQRLLVIAHEDIGIANPMAIISVRSFRADFMEFRENGKDGSARLALTNALSLLARSPKSRMTDHLQVCVFDPQERGERLEIPDYALDRHTLRGKQLGRGYKEWLDEGCVLVPPADPTFEVHRAEFEKRTLSPDGLRRPDWGSKKKQAGNLDLFDAEVTE